MQRVVAVVGSSRAHFPVVLFRVLLWVEALILLLAGIPLRPEHSSTVILLLVIGTGLYTLAISLRIVPFSRAAQRYPLLLLADLLVSFLPIWISGGYLSPLVPFVLGSLILPGALFGWRGTALALVAYFLLDHAGAWLVQGSQALIPIAAPGGLLLYLRPLLAASIWPLSVILWRLGHGRQPANSPRPPASQALPRLWNRATRTVEAVPRSVSREEAGGTATAITLARPRSQTIEPPPFVELLPAVRQAIGEAEAHGLEIQVLAGVEELWLPPGHACLARKAIAVALDNVRCHAGTGCAEVSVNSDGANVVLAVRDHGAGLLDGTAEPPGFHQLKRLRYRLEEIEGSLDVYEAIGGGVIVTVRIPLVA